MRYSWRLLQHEVRTKAITEQDVLDAIDDPRLKRNYWIGITQSPKSQHLKEVTILPKARDYTKLSNFEIPDVCFWVGDSKTRTPYKIDGMYLMFTRKAYADAYLNENRLSGTSAPLGREQIFEACDRIILDYVDHDSDLPIFDVAERMIQYYMSSLDED